MRQISIGVWCVGMACVSALAQESIPPRMDDLSEQIGALKRTMEQLQGLVEKQQDRIVALEEANRALREHVSTPPTRGSATPTPNPTVKGFQRLNPEIGVVLDLVATSSESRADSEGNDRLAVREMELVIGQEVDPYGRFDSTITFSDFEDVEVEEAYVTYWDLPWDLQLRAGRMRPKIGKANLLHRDQLDTVDEPLVIQRYLGIEGLFKTGVELSRFLPKPASWWTPELTLGAMEGGVGEDGALFGSTRRRLSFYAHLKNFFEISDSSDFELGLTYLMGSQDDDGRFEVNTLGVETTYHRYFSEGRRLKLQSELYAQDRRESFAFDDDGFVIDYRGHPFGFYSLLDYRINTRWGIGARIDYVEPVSNPPWNPHHEDRGYSTYVTFYQSEFARLRLQYERVELANGDEDDMFFLQGTYSLGVHKHAIK